MAKASKKKIISDKTPKEASELFHRIMKASLTVPLKTKKKKKQD